MFIPGQRIYPLDGGTGGSGGNGGGDGGGGGGGARTYTQAEIDELISKRIAREKTKFDDESKKMLSRIEELQKKATLTVQEKEELESELGELRKKVLSADELQARAREDERKKWKGDLDVTSAKAERSDRLYRNALAQTALTTAAAKHKAYNPEHIVQLLGGRIQFEPKATDKGELTGYELKIKLTLPTEDGKGKEEKILDVDEGVKLFLDQPENANLVAASGRGGAGSGGGGGGGGAPAGGFFTESQITNVEFFNKNKAAILKAAKEGRIRPG